MVKRSRTTESPTGEPETIGAAVGQVLENVQPCTEPDCFDRAIAAQSEMPAREPGQDEPEAEEGPKKSPWKQRFGYWRHEPAGVRIEEDRTNKLTSIMFREKAPEEAQKLLRERGYVKEDDFVFSRKIDTLRAHEDRKNSDTDVLDVTNIVLKGKGLPQIDNYYITQRSM